MRKCINCYSYAINHHLYGRDNTDLDLCDICFWRKRAIPAQGVDARPNNVCAVPCDQLQELQTDAGRYRWLKPRLLGVDFDWNENGESVLVFEWPSGLRVGADCDKNIDAAIHQQVKAGQS